MGLSAQGHQVARGSASFFSYISFWETVTPDYKYLYNINLAVMSMKWEYSSTDDKPPRGIVCQNADFSCLVHNPIFELGKQFCR